MICHAGGCLRQYPGSVAHISTRLVGGFRSCSVTISTPTQRLARIALPSAKPTLAAIALAAELGPEEREDFARSFCAAVLSVYWGHQCELRGCRWPLRKPEVSIPTDFQPLIESIADVAAGLELPDAGFFLGKLYTALLPDSVRKKLGAYYTPPALVERLLTLVTESGFSWQTGRVIDPACGGAAFLASVAPRMVRASTRTSALAVLEDLESRLLGVEVDSFAAWMSMVLLDVALLELIIIANRLPRPRVLVSDALAMAPAYTGNFDLVVGNPPYGRVTLSDSHRNTYRASLFGHANLYGLFTDLAIRLAKPGGLIAYVTPTSFLGGEYFKNLRKLLAEKAPLKRVEFVEDRAGVFEGVLQETMLTVFTKGARDRVLVRVGALESTGNDGEMDAVGLCEMPLVAERGEPWILPRRRLQTALVRKLNRMPARLSDHEFSVATGQLVWNRHKEQLRQKYESNVYPIVWAEAVTSTGEFRFQSARSARQPFLKLRPGQDFLVNHEPCVLVQRTTAKEQKRRLVAAVVPNAFVLDHPGFIVENHLNMIFSKLPQSRFSLQTLVTLLNSATVDQAFRCISGSVAVSAYELNSLPLPNGEQMQRLQELLLDGCDGPAIGALIAEFYE